MLKFSCQTKPDLKKGVETDSASKIIWDNEIKTISDVVNRALCEHFASKGVVPENTTITIKSENGNINIVVS